LLLSCISSSISSMIMLTLIHWRCADLILLLAECWYAPLSSTGGDWPPLVFCWALEFGRVGPLLGPSRSWGGVCLVRVAQPFSCVARLF
jgi:hypothetical protein